MTRRVEAPEGFRLSDVLVIHNPDAGDRSQPAELLRQVLADAGHDPRYVSTDEEWEAALGEPADLVVVVGGDGTVAEVVRTLRGSERVVAVLPTGMANNLAKTLGVGGDARTVVASWEAGILVPLDVWMAEAPSVQAPFVEALGGGFLASMMARGHELEPPTFILGSEFDRALHLLRDALADEPVRHWGIEVNGVDHSGPLIGIEVMNGPYVGPNIPLAPDAEAGDGGLDVVFIHESDRASFAARSETLADAQARRSGALTIVKGDDVRLVPPPDVALHLDGDPWDPKLAEGDEIRVSSGGVVRVLVPSAR